MGGPRPEPSEAVSLVPLLAQAGVGRSHHPGAEAGGGRCPIAGVAPGTFGH